MTHLATVPPIEELSPHRYDSECYEVAAAIAQQYPHLKEDAGFYIHPNRGVGDHGWNIAPDGTIVDMTAKQHDYSGPEDESSWDETSPPTHPEIIRPGDPEYSRYVSWERHEPQAQTLAHDLGYHDGSEEDYLGVCPQCSGHKTADGSAGGGAGGWGGDAFPGQMPQTTFDNAEARPGGEDWNPAEDYRFFYGNGQLHVSEDHEYDELASHAGVRGDHTGPIALGRIHVDMGKAMFEIHGNINAHGLARILKDYCKDQGWRWGGMTDLQGEPVDTGSEFAPVKSYYYAVENDQVFLSSQHKNSFRAAGAVHVAGNLAYLHGPGHEGLLEWATDNALTLIGGNDNVLKRIEDLEIDNNYTPEWNNEDEHFMFENEGDQRMPGGVYKCPECSQIFPSYALYLRHRSQEDPIKEEPNQDGKFPELNPDATFPPNTSEPLRFYEGAIDTEVVRVPEGTGMGDDISFGWRVPVVFDAHRNRVGVGWPGDYHSDVHEALGNFRSGRPMAHFHEGWISIPDEERSVPEYGLRMRTGEEYAPAIQKALTPLYPQASKYLQTDDDGLLDEEWDMITGKVAAPKAPAPKDVLAAPLPFLYDIEEDQIIVGQPGQRTSDIPGQFTPGGIVEGTYEPGGKVFIRSMTNMPYTVRHMLELWYYQHPEMEVTNVHLLDDAGGKTKLAAQDIGGYLAKLTAADPVAFASSRALMKAGGKVFVVGGAVRDALLGKEPKDIDLMVTGLDSDKVASILGSIGRGGSVKLTGKDFGVFRYVEHGHEVEISLPRRERELRIGPNGRPLPGDVDHTMTPEEDLFRRDFTANAMAVDLSNGQLIDPFHGSDDVQAHTLRTLNTKSLADDPLRTVRALVARSRHGLIPDRETTEQMAEHAHLVQHLPKDRIQPELDKLFDGDDPESAIRLAIDTGLIDHIFPEVSRAVGHSQNNPHHELELGDHLINVMQRAKERKPDDPDFALAGLLHDIGKVDSHWTECRDCGWKAHGHSETCPACGNANTSGHFYELEPGIGKAHESVGAKQAYDRLMELRYPKERAERIRDLIQHHMFPGFTTEKGARKFLNTVGPHADDLLDLRWADQGGKSEYPTDPSLSVDQHQQLLQNVRMKGQATNKSQLAVSGRDLIQEGMKPGPEMGQMLQRLTDAVLDNPELNTREGLLGLYRAWQGLNS